MKLQKQMFGLISDWYDSELFKKDFLADKNISQGKFDYWLKKYHSDAIKPEPIAVHGVQNDFTQISLPDISNKIKLTKIIELKTASGIELTIFEKC